MKNLGNLMKQASQMQEKMNELQARLGNTEIEGSSGGGMVRVFATGRGDMLRVKIDKSLCVAEESEVLEDLIVAACNDAKTKAETLAQSEMGKLTGGLNLPAGLKLPF